MLEVRTIQTKSIEKASNGGGLSRTEQQTG